MRDAGGCEEQVRAICVNAKTSYPGGAVCNAVEKILFHKDAAEKLLPKVCARSGRRGVEIRGDERRARSIPPPSRPTNADWPLEYLSLHRRRESG